MPTNPPAPHSHRHAFTWTHAQEREGLMLLTRRNLLKASLAGIAGLTVPDLLAHQARAAAAGKPMSRKSVVLLWMAGGPSHIDTWDPKPDRPLINRGPFKPINTRLPGVLVCEHLPKMAAMLHRFTLIRSVDPRGSNHEPNAVFQTANRDAEPRVNREAHLYPAIGSVVAKHHGSNHPALPAYATFMKSRSHVAFAGYLGRRYDPFIADYAAELPIYTDVGVDTGRTTASQAFRMPRDVTPERIVERRGLAQSFDQMRRDLDAGGNLEAMQHFERQAADMLTGRRAREAFAEANEFVRRRYRKGWEVEGL